VKIRKVLYMVRHICCYTNKKLRYKPDAKQLSNRKNKISGEPGSMKYGYKYNEAETPESISFHIQTAVTQTQEPSWFSPSHTCLLLYNGYGNARKQKQQAMLHCVLFILSLLDIEDLLYLPDLLTAYRTKTRSFSYPAYCTSNF